MRVAGFDLATVTGAAVLDGGKLVHSETFRPFVEGDLSDGDRHAQIFRGFRLWLFKFLKEQEIDRAAIEAPLITTLKRKLPDGSEVPMSNISTFLVLYGVRAIALETTLRVLGEPAVEVNQSTWRAAFLPKRRKGSDLKALAVAQCKLLRWDVKSRDEADACGVAWWLEGELKRSRRLQPPAPELFEARR